MGRQWLQKKREINANKRAKITTKLVREITVAAKLGAPDPTMNARLEVAVEAARKQSVSNDVIARAIKKAAGGGDGAAQLELVTFEGMAPHKVPVIVECLTDNRNRTAPDMRSLFREAQFGAKVMFLFDHVGTIEATHEDGALDREGAAIEAGAQDVESLEDTPEGHSGARFFTEPADLDAVLRALKAAGWRVTTSEMGYRPKDKVTLSPEQRGEVESFLEAIDDHDDCHRIYTALA
ncbi:MAG: YebC/PmpR family DNA-binding transcriptional regulator [Planctomycetes bacterium]|nr:YebC/PmpR family DNA-binding transcriptional regulator [Planctomycetota bacterium]